MDRLKNRLMDRLKNRLKDRSIYRQIYQPVSLYYKFYILIDLLEVKLLYNLKCPSVCPTVRLSATFSGKHEFLSCYLRQKSNSFFVKIPLIYVHLFYKSFVRQSVVGQATNDIMKSSHFMINDGHLLYTSLCPFVPIHFLISLSLSLCSNNLFFL